MKKLVSIILAVVLTLGCVAGVCFAAEPFAEVTNGTDTVKVSTVEELRALINDDGKTSIKFLTDYEYTGTDYFINNAASVTVDLDGHTFKAKAEGGGFVYVGKVGNMNGVTTVKNGTIITNVKNVRLDKGGLRLENIKGYTFASYNVSYADKTDNYNDDNIVTGCYLVAAKYYVLAYGTAQKNLADHSMVNVKVENSTLIQAKTPGTAIFSRNSTVVIPGSFELGDDVVMMTRNQQGKGAYFENAAVVTGKNFSKTENGTISMTFPELDGHKVDGMCKYETGPAGTGTYKPKVEASAEPFCEVTTNGQTVQVKNPTSLSSLISKDGTSVIKMLSDYTYNGNQYFLNNVPTCTLDLNGYTLKATESSGGGVYVGTLGTTNGVTVIKNGTIICDQKQARVDVGGLRMENVKGYTISGYNISISDKTPTYNEDNLITGCYLVNAKSAVFAYGVNTSSAADHSMVSTKIENSTLIQAKTPGTSIFSSNGTHISHGLVMLGQSVVLMTRNQQNGGYYNKSRSAISGEKVTMTEKGTVDMTFPQLGISVEAMCKWETPKGDFDYTPGPAVEKIPDFADVAKDFWGYEAIMNAAAAGLVKGKSENTDGSMNYVPNAAMTRAEFITVICRYFFPVDADAVTAGEKWWTGYYDLAIAKEFVMASELDGGELDKAMTREEMALVLSRTAPAMKAYSAVTPADASAIPDYASVGADFTDAVLWAYGAGLLKGVDAAGTFNPAGELNRAAVATIFNTLLTNQ